METNLPTQPTQTPPVVEQTPVPTQSVVPPVPQSTPVPPKKSNFLLIALTAIVTGVLIIGAILAYQKFFTTKPTAVVSSTSSPIPTIGPTADWKMYQIADLQTTFKLPPQFQPETEERLVKKGDTGSYLSWFFYENGVNVFSIGTTSTDFSAGRGGTFLDLEGFVVESGVYFAKFINGYKFSLKGQRVYLVNSPYNLPIIKIMSAYPSNPEGLPPAGTPGDGYIGALSNLNSGGIYTGFAIEMKLSETSDEKLFDQILSTFRFME